MLHTSRPSLDEEQCVITGEDVSSAEEEEEKEAKEGGLHPRLQGPGWLHAATTEELREMIRVRGGESLLSRRASLSYDQASLRAVLEDLIKNGSREPERHLPDNLVASWMRGVADEWPPDEIAPPRNADEARDVLGPWGPAARGVEIRECTDVPGKGKGVFATRRIP